MPAMINGYEDRDELTSLFYFRCDLEYDLVMTLTVTTVDLSGDLDCDLTFQSIPIESSPVT